MDVLTFISKIVEVLAWPAVVLALVVLLRYPLAELLTTLKKLHFKDWVDLEFGEELKQAKVQADAAKLPLLSEAVAPPSPPPEPALVRYERLAGVSPVATVLEAWSDVERGLTALLEKVRGRRPEQEDDIWTFLQELGKAGKFDLRVLFLLTTLRKMRNSVAADGNYRLAKTDALEYARLAVRVMAEVQTISRN